MSEPVLPPARARTPTASTHHHPRKKLLNRLHAIVSGPKRLLGNPTPPILDPYTPSGGSETSSSVNSNLGESDDDEQQSSSKRTAHLDDQGEDGRAERRRGRSGTALPMAIQSAAASSNAGRAPPLFRSDSAYSSRVEHIIDTETPQPPVIIRPHFKIRIVTWWVVR